MEKSDNDTSATWLGSTIDEIKDKYEASSLNAHAPVIEASESHTVLFKLPLPGDENEFPVPTVNGDKWDGNHVRLPTNPNCKYSKIDEDGSKSEKQRWELIVGSLTETPITNSRELEAAIKTYTKLANEWRFTTLHDLFEDYFNEDDTEYFFSDVLPKIIALALRLPELIQSPIPLLKKKLNHSVSLSQEQAACLLANAFLCTFPRRNMGRKDTDYPEINFNRLFSEPGRSVIEKLKCILSYFRRVCCLKMPIGVITFQRRYIVKESLPNWEKSDVNFKSIKLQVSSEGTIEDGIGMLQIDFANKFLGGGVLGRGCVQEEIRFVINPELIVGMLFCESMDPQEAILMTGCERFNRYSGYASSFQWCGIDSDETPRDCFRRRKTSIVAIDALLFHKPYMQFEPFLLNRELNKAFIGFYHNPTDESLPQPIATGNWGCGAFRGSKTLKALIQLMACCANRRNVVYYTFGDAELMDHIHEMFEFLKLKDITIGLLWSYLQAFKEKKLASEPDLLYSFIFKQHGFCWIGKQFLGESTAATPEDAEKAEGSEASETPDENTPMMETESKESLTENSFENPPKRRKTNEGDDSFLNQVDECRIDIPCSVEESPSKSTVNPE